MATLEKVRQWLSILIIPVFIGLLLLPTLDTLLHTDRAPVPNENRMLAEFPHYEGVAKLKPFISGLEAYFNDHFGYRKRLVRWHNKWKGRWFGEAPVSKVIVGKNNWLYMSKNTFEEYTGQSRFSEKDLNEWQSILETRRDWLAKRGIKYLFVIAPDKHSIYPENLPGWMVKSPLPTKCEQFMAHMKAHSTVELFALHDALREASKSRFTYLATDTHWNQYGAFIGCQTLVKALSRQIPGLEPLPLEAFDCKPAVQKGGDLARMLGQEFQETQQIILSPRAPLEPLAQEPDISRLIKLTTNENDGIITRNVKATGKVLVFRDSFATAMVPFFGYHFNEVVYIWRYQWDAASIDNEKPDVVIDEMVERNFNIFGAFLAQELPQFK